MAAPPLLAGAVQLTVARPSPATAVAPVGAPGTDGSVAILTSSASRPWPSPGPAASTASSTSTELPAGTTSVGRRADDRAMWAVARAPPGPKVVSGDPVVETRKSWVLVDPSIP